jgi:excisionase family DNA binding protein
VRRRPRTVRATGVVAVTERTEPLLTVSEAVERIGVSRRTVYTLIANGELPSVKVGGSRRFVAADVDRFIAERREGGA